VYAMVDVFPSSTNTLVIIILRRLTRSPLAGVFNGFAQPLGRRGCIVPGEGDPREKRRSRTADLRSGFCLVRVGDNTGDIVQFDDNDLSVSGSLFLVKCITHIILDSKQLQLLQTLSHRLK
jgi:hypothetical protein